MGIDPEARVHASYIGEGTNIYQFASVRNSRMGKDCVVWPFAMIDGSTFGDRCIVASGVVMGPGFLIGNGVFIGPGVVLCNDMWPRVDKSGFEILGTVIEVKDGASIGANATLLPGITIGQDAMVAAGAVASIDVPDGCLLDRDGNLRLIKRAWRERRMRYV